MHAQGGWRENSDNFPLVSGFSAIKNKTSHSFPAEVCSIGLWKAAPRLAACVVCSCGRPLRVSSYPRLPLGVPVPRHHHPRNKSSPHTLCESLKGLQGGGGGGPGQLKLSFKETLREPVTADGRSPGLHGSGDGTLTQRVLHCLPGRSALR